MPALAFTLLDPFSAALSAGLAVPALLLWYFLKLRRRPVRVSSTFLWTSAAADLQVNVPFRWLRASWLLLLQLLALALLCTALGRPAVESGGLAGGRLVLVIDRSASMAAKDAEPNPDRPVLTRLDLAKERALAAIDRLGPQAQAMVVAMAHRPVALTTFTRDRGVLRAAVRAIEVFDQPADLEAALRLAGAVASTTEADQTDLPTVLVLSDGSFERDPSSPSPARVGRARFEFVRTGPDPQQGQGGPSPVALAPNNLGIVSVAARRSIDSPSIVNAFFRVQSVAAVPTTALVTAEFEGQPVASVPIELPEASAQAPREVSRSFEFEAPGGGALVLTLQRPDLLTADNTVGLVINPPRAPRLLLVQPNLPETVVDYLPLDALASLGPAELNAITEAQYQRLVAERGLAAYDLMVFDRVSPSQAPPVPTLSFGASMPLPGLSVDAPEPATPDAAPTTFTFWSRSHPVLRYVALGSVPVMQPRRVTIPDRDRAERQGPAAGSSAAAALGPDASYTVLASGTAGPLIVLAEQAGVRRLIVGFELAQSTWWREPSFPVFIKNAVDFLSGAGEDSSALAIDTTQSVSIRPARGSERIDASGPAPLVRPVAPGTAAVSIGPFTAAGLYQLDGADPRDELLAVNLTNASESALNTAPSLVIGGQDIAAGTSGLSAPREVWHWFILAAFLVLAVEWALFARKMRL